MYCPSCGKQISDSLHYCVYCGSNISGSKNETGPPHNREGVELSGKKRSRPKLVILISSIVLILIVAGVLLAVFLPRNSEQAQIKQWMKNVTGTDIVNEGKVVNDKTTLNRIAGEYNADLSPLNSNDNTLKPGAEGTLTYNQDGSYTMDFTVDGVNTDSLSGRWQLFSYDINSDGKEEEIVLSALDDSPNSAGYPQYVWFKDNGSRPYLIGVDGSVNTPR